MTVRDDRWPRRHADAAWLRAALPDGDAAALVPIGRGVDSLAFRCGASVVRVARSAQAADGLQREACTLARIADHLPVAVPRPTFARPAACRAFSVHAALEGVALTGARWRRLRAPARERAAADLAGFLASLHELPVADVRPCALPVLGCAAHARRLRADAERLHDLLAPAVRERLDATLGAWAQGADVPPVVLHRDLSPDHVLHDPASGRITGILDFGDLAIGDPARDFIFLREDVGEALLAAVLRRYPHARAATLAPRVRQWGLLEAVEWTLGRHAARRAGERRAGERRADELREGLAAVAQALDDALDPALAPAAGGA